MGSTPESRGSEPMPMSVALFLRSPSLVVGPPPTACLSDEVKTRRKSDCFFTCTWYTLGDNCRYQHKQLEPVVAP